MKKRFFSLEKEGKQGVLYIYDDITSTGATELVNQLKQMNDVEVLRVYINSLGGEVSGGLAIYNALSRFSGKVFTYNDGLMASAATLPFCAGKVRVANRASAGLIHQAWAWGEGNANDFIKQAKDLEVITKASVEIYKSVTGMTEEEIVALMDEERWLSPDEMVAYGLATKIKELGGKGVQQSVKSKVLGVLIANQKAKAESEEEEVLEEEELEDEEVIDDDLEEIPEDEEIETEELDEDEEVLEDDELEEDEIIDEEEEVEEDDILEEEEEVVVKKVKKKVKKVAKKNDEIATQSWVGFFNALVE